MFLEDFKGHMVPFDTEAAEGLMPASSPPGTLMQGTAIVFQAIRHIADKPAGHPT